MLSTAGRAARCAQTALLPIMVRSPKLPKDFTSPGVLCAVFSASLAEQIA
jgi:hypothetical protein